MMLGRLRWQGNRRKAMSNKVYDFFFEPDFSTVDMMVLFALLMSCELWVAMLSGIAWIVFSSLFLMDRYV